MIRSCFKLLLSTAAVAALAFSAPALAADQSPSLSGWHNIGDTPNAIMASAHGPMTPITAPLGGATFLATTILPDGAGVKNVRGTTNANDAWKTCHDNGVGLLAMPTCILHSWSKPAA